MDFFHSLLDLILVLYLICLKSVKITILDVKFLFRSMCKFLQ